MGHKHAKEIKILRWIAYMHSGRRFRAAHVAARTPKQF